MDLHEITSTVELSLKYNQYTPAAFLDTDKEFNKISTNAIKEVQNRIGLERYLAHWRVFKLRTRIIQSNLGCSHLTRAVSR